MKKSLIALAVLAAAGAVSAQTVTLSGKFAGAYQSGSRTVTTAGVAAAGTSTNGFGVTDGNVTFAAVEDLGGGMKAGTSMDVRVRGRGAAGVVDGRNGTVFVSGGFGSVTLGSIESASGINPLGGAGAPVQDLTDVNLGFFVTGGAATAALTAPLNRPANLDVFIYTTPKFGGFSGTLLLGDSIGAPGANGMEDRSATQDATLLGLNYAGGPVAFVGDYTTFGVNGNTGTPAAAAYKADTRLRLSASYDLGVAKLGAGYQSQSYQSYTATATGIGRSAGVPDLKIKEYVLGVSAPMGAFVVGANYTRRSADDVAGAFTGHSVTGWDLGVQYNLSKRTAVQADYRTVNAEASFVGAAGADKIEDKNIRIRLMHTF